MYKIYFVNFHYYADTTFDHLDRAFAFGKSRGFEFVVTIGSRIVGTWSPIRGVKLF